jgi:hypothetical protein
MAADEGIDLTLVTGTLDESGGAEPLSRRKSGGFLHRRPEDTSLGVREEVNSNVAASSDFSCRREGVAVATSSASGDAASAAAASTGPATILSETNII